MSADNDERLDYDELHGQEEDERQDYDMPEDYYEQMVRY